MLRRDEARITREQSQVVSGRPRRFRRHAGNLRPVRGAPAFDPRV
ncbi:MAG: hypothetical protein ACREFJ_14335 [Acetobacteraceae bacterium]